MTYTRTEKRQYHEIKELQVKLKEMTEIQELLLQQNYELQKDLDEAIQIIMEYIDEQ